MLKSGNARLRNGWKPEREGNITLQVSRIFERPRSQGARVEKIELNDLNTTPRQSNRNDRIPNTASSKRTCRKFTNFCDLATLWFKDLPRTLRSACPSKTDGRPHKLPHSIRPRAKRMLGLHAKDKKEEKGIFIAVTGGEQEFEQILTTA